MDDWFTKLTDKQLMILKLEGLSLSAQSEALGMTQDALKKYRAELHRIFETNDLTKYAREARLRSKKENK